jgi:broad specificity phosphatase PhoE
VGDAIGDGFQTIVVVGHQDPIQTLRLGLVGRPLSELRHDPPGHASVTTITSDDGATFVEVSMWSPQIIDL